MAVRKSNGVVAVVAAFVITSSTFVIQQGVAEDHLRCRKSEFLTANRTLLPLSNITTFNLNLLDPLVRFVDENTMPWCSNFYGSNHHPNHLNMTFTKPVVVEGITSRGSFNQGFVSNFSVFVPQSLDSINELELLDEEFIPPSQLREYMIVDSFVARRVQFRINRIAESAAWFCWQIQLVGCVAENSVVTNTGTDQPSCSRTTSTPRITDQPSCSLVATITSFVTVQPSCTVSVGGAGGAGAARQSAANGVIGGGAVLLVVGVVLMVVAVIIVLVVVLTRKKSSHGSVNLQPQSHVENGRSQTILKIENVDLYTSNSHDDGLLTNQLYDIDERTLAEPGCDTVQSVQTVTKPSPNYDTAVDDRRVENERNIYSSIHDAMDSTDKQQDQTMPTVTHRNQTSQVNDKRYCEVAFNTSKGEDSGAADVYASIDT